MVETAGRSELEEKRKVTLEVCRLALTESIDRSPIRALTRRGNGWEVIYEVDRDTYRKEAGSLWEAVAAVHEHIEFFQRTSAASGEPDG